MEIVCKCDRCKVKVDITHQEKDGWPEGWVTFRWNGPDMLLPLKLCTECSKAAKTFLTGGDL